MTLTGAKADLRQLLDQTSTSNTQWDDTNLLPDVLDRARRAFAAILPESEIPKLIKSASLSVTNGVGAYPTDFFKKMENPYVTITPSGGSATPAKRIPPEEAWRLFYFETSDITKAGSSNTYYREMSNGIRLYPTSSTACSYEYIMVPTALAAGDNVELPTYIDDLVIWHAFEQCMATQRGDQDLAKFLYQRNNLNLKQVLP